MEEMKIRVLLVDDHQIIRDGVKTMLMDETDIHFVGSAENGLMALSMASSLKPDIVISDISMPEMSGIELCKKIVGQIPDCKVLILSMYTTDNYIFDAIQAGAKGILPKQETTREMLLTALRTIYTGAEFYAPSVSRKMLSTFVSGIKRGTHAETPKYSLTPREKEILTLYVEGCSNKEVANQLNISIRTVETHKNNIMQKFGFKSTVEMIKYALVNNIVIL